jgi:AcrR family transcriptional regulator
LYLSRITSISLHWVIERNHAVTDQDVPARRGRPRDAGVDERVLTVTWDLLLAGGYAGLNIDEVAERAAVAKTTLYRRWPTKDHLIIAVVTRTIPPVPVPDTGDLRHDLTEFAVSLTAVLNQYRTAGRNDGVSSGLAGELVAAAARHPDIGDVVRALHARRHAMALARLRRASEREGLPPGIDHALVVDQISGPIYYRVLITGQTADRDYAERLVRAVLAGARSVDARAG